MGTYDQGDLITPRNRRNSTHTKSEKAGPGPPPLAFENQSQAGGSHQPAIDSTLGTTNTNQVTRDDHDGGTEAQEAFSCIKQLIGWRASRRQLRVEIDEIYEALNLLEKRCIEFTQSQTCAARQNPKHTLTDGQLRFLIDLHLAYQRQHHDIYMATQHPMVEGDMRHLARKHELPARFWRHGVYSFLELLRLKLPKSFEHMMVFINQSYHIITLFYETVEDFKVIWMECLGDVGRYRVSLEAQNIWDRTHWAGVSASWFLRVSDHQPMTGRLDHHVAVCSRPQPIRQLLYYFRSLTLAVPFEPARESIMNLLNPIMAEDSTHALFKLPPVEASFIRSHAILFTGKYPEKLDTSVDGFVDGLDTYISERNTDWLSLAYQIAIVNCCALLGYRSPDTRAKRQPKLQNFSERPPEAQLSTKTMSIFTRTAEVVLRRTCDTNILPLVHVTMAMMYYFGRTPAAQRIFLARCPWSRIVTALNAFLPEQASREELKTAEQPVPVPQDGQAKTRPLPEDLAMRGLPFAYLPLHCVTGEAVVDDERELEVPSLSETRKKRIFWLARRVASLGSGLMFDDVNHQFKMAHSTKL